MDPVTSENALHRIRHLTEVDNIEKANNFLEQGWILLQIKSEEYSDVYTLGWPSTAKPVWPEPIPSKYAHLYED